jgi:uncharacterized protein YqeY
MDIRSRLQEALKTAMRSNDDVQKRTIRMALTAIQLAEVDKSNLPEESKGEKPGALDDKALVAIIQKEIKSRRETILDAQKAARPDIIAAAVEEIHVLEAYLPVQLSEDDLRKMVEEAAAEVGAKTPADTGKVMKILLPRIQGQAPNDKVSQMVRQVLTAA